jgi:hypothetical protein
LRFSDYADVFRRFQEQPQSLSNDGVIINQQECDLFHGRYHLPT